MGLDLHYATIFNEARLKIADLLNSSTIYDPSYHTSTYHGGLRMVIGFEPTLIIIKVDVFTMLFI